MLSHFSKTFQKAYISICGFALWSGVFSIFVIINPMKHIAVFTIRKEVVNVCIILMRIYRKMYPILSTMNWASPLLLVYFSL